MMIHNKYDNNIITSNDTENNFNEYFVYLEIDDLIKLIFCL